MPIYHIKLVNDNGAKIGCGVVTTGSVPRTSP